MTAKLPKPVTVTDQYLAAILAELERLNSTMDNLSKRSSSVKPETAKSKDTSK